MSRITLKIFFWLAFTSLLCSPFTSLSYSVLTHEAIVDASWEHSLQPLLKSRYPGVTELQLKEAHAFAYGGAISPDMGYFPFGSRLFTNLVHYVRSGDFVSALLEESRDVNEYAFALGFMCHYMSDKYGHDIGTNQCVPIVYPKMRKKYGSTVTYAEDKLSHKRMEFTFDVLETASGNYASEAYHDFIGFRVSRELLERTFPKIYGLEIRNVFGNFSLAVETFRWSVRSLFPVLTKTAWVIKRADILKLQPTATSRSFRKKMARANYYEEFGKKHKKPGLFANMLGWLMVVLPKVGPLKSLKLKAPGPIAEKLFIQSFDTVLVKCAASMKALGKGTVQFTNIDFDTGNETSPGEYRLADINYGNLLQRLDKNRFILLSAGLKSNVMDFYSNPTVSIARKKCHRSWEKISRALVHLRDTAPNTL